MAIEIKVPSLGESVTEATVARWLKQPGEPVAQDEPVVELETDKVNVEVPAPAAGTLAVIVAAEGTNLPVGGVLGTIGEAAAAPAAKPTPLEATLPLPGERGASRPGDGEAAARHPGPLPAGGESEGPAPAPTLTLPRGRGREGEGASGDHGSRALQRSGPAVRKLVAESGLEAAAITPTGPGARITKADVLAALSRHPAAPAAPAAPERAPPGPPAAPATAPSVPAPPATQAEAPSIEIGAREVRVRMTRLRRVIAERLKAAQNTAAMLTTFNEIDMSRTIALREAWRDAFEKKHGVRLGFMSIFVKAAVAALKEIPGVNAEIDGDDIVYKNHYDIGVAVGTEHGLVVPVLRDADRLSFAEIEKEIAALGRKARDGKLSIADLSGGTFTISNGGIYGSLLSTPILNPPQSGILGMHKIERRPVAVAGGTGETIEIRPMMYVALSYDHRIVDGREAVGFLVRIKELVEDPSRLLFEI